MRAPVKPSHTHGPLPRCLAWTVVLGVAHFRVCTRLLHDLHRLPLHHRQLAAWCVAHAQRLRQCTFKVAPCLPAATSVTGNAKDIIGTFVGAIAFNDFKPTPYSVTGIAISFLGAAAFSGAKLAEMRSDAAKPIVQTAPEVGVKELSPREIDAIVSRSAVSPLSGARRNLVDSGSDGTLPAAHYQRQTAAESSGASHGNTSAGQGLPGGVTRRDAIIVASVGR